MTPKNIPVKPIVVYSLVMVSFTLYWDYDIFDLVRLKGDNYLYSIMSAISITYIFYLWLYLTWQKIKPLFFAFMPIIIALASIIAWFLSAGVIQPDTTTIDIRIITITYLVFSNIFVLLVWRKRRNKSEGFEGNLIHVEK